MPSLDVGAIVRQYTKRLWPVCLEFVDGERVPSHCTLETTVLDAAISKNGPWKVAKIICRPPKNVVVVTCVGAKGLSNFLSTYGEAELTVQWREEQENGETIFRFAFTLGKKFIRISNDGCQIFDDFVFVNDANEEFIAPPTGKARYVIGRALNEVSLMPLPSAMAGNLIQNGLIKLVGADDADIQLKLSISEQFAYDTASVIKRLGNSIDAQAIHEQILVWIGSCAKAGISPSEIAHAANIIVDACPARLRRHADAIMREEIRGYRSLLDSVKAYSNTGHDTSLVKVGKVKSGFSFPLGFLDYGAVTIKSDVAGYDTRIASAIANDLASDRAIFGYFNHIKIDKFAFVFIGGNAGRVSVWAGQHILDDTKGDAYVKGISSINDNFIADLEAMNADAIFIVGDKQSVTHKALHRVVRMIDKWAQANNKLVGFVGGSQVQQIPHMHIYYQTSKLAVINITSQLMTPIRFGIWDPGDAVNKIRTWGMEYESFYHLVMRAIMTFIYNNKMVNLHDLSFALGAKTGIISCIMRRLENNGIVKKMSNRESSWEITPIGMDMAKEYLESPSQSRLLLSEPTDEEKIAIVAHSINEVNGEAI